MGLKTVTSWFHSQTADFYDAELQNLTITMTSVAILLTFMLRSICNITVSFAINICFDAGFGSESEQIFEVIRNNIHNAAQLLQKPFLILTFLS